MGAMRFFLAFFFSFLLDAATQAQWWTVQTSGLDTNLRGVSVAEMPDAMGAPVPVVWASGSNGVILKSIDEGKTWKRLRVTGGHALDFRGIVAFNASTAYVMSSGEGEKSRIDKTTDGGESWTVQYTDKRKEFFLDSIVCVSETLCYALSDPIDGKFLLLKTVDGEHWNPLPNGSMPAALPGEGAFAASNTCLAFSGGDEIYFGTGGPVARVFHSTDSGRTWTVAETPIGSGKPSAGIFSLALGDDNRIMALGGDYKDPGRRNRVAAYSLDKGKTWHLAARQPAGYRSAVAHIDYGEWGAVVPNGEDFSTADGPHWKHTDSLNLNPGTLLYIFTHCAVPPHPPTSPFDHHTHFNYPH